MIASFLRADFLMEWLLNLFADLMPGRGREFVGFLAFCILVHVPTKHISSQNLVPNPGFEEYLEEPNYSAAGVNSAPGWSRLNRTTDFFHNIYEYPAGVPNNFRGRMEPASGEGYAGIISYIFGSSTDVEFLVTKLTEPLQNDQIYDLSFEVSLSNQSRYGVDGVGAVVLNDEPTQEELIDYQYTVRNEYGVALGDTSRWVKIARQFRAEGGEQYLLIGSLFNEWPITFSDIIDPNIPWAYYYIDNVYLAPCPKPVITELALDTSICKGNSLMLSGLDDAKSHHWHQGGVRKTREVKEDGLYVLDNHYDCKIIQQHFQVSFEDCDCDLGLPTLYNHSNEFYMNVSPIVLSWDLQMFDGWGRFILRADEEIGLDPTSIPAVSAPYFWSAQLSCRGPEDNVFFRTVSGKLIIQD